MIYLVIGILLAYMSFVEIFSGKVHFSKIHFQFMLFILFSISFLRYNVGPDWAAYLAFYNDPAKAKLIVEIGYRSLNNLFSSFHVPYFVFLAVVSAITLFFIYRVGLGLKYKSIFLLCYFSNLFIYYNFSGMRQGIAIAITLFSIKYIYNKDFTKFMLLVILASLFHISALIFVIAYFAFSIRFTKFRILLLLLLLAAFDMYSIDLVHIILSHLDPSLFKAHLNFYFNIAPLNSNNLLHLFQGIIIRSVILFIFLSLPASEKNKFHLKQYISIYLVGLCIFILFYSINPDVGTRVASYFILVGIIIVSIFFQLDISRNHKLFIFLTMMSVCMFKLYNYSNMESFSYGTILL
jgi:hypothetical protein